MGGGYCDGAEVAASGGADVDANVVGPVIVIMRVAFAGARVPGQRHACSRAALQRIAVNVQIAGLH